jgi:hypothetical protein
MRKQTALLLLLCGLVLPTIGADCISDDGDSYDPPRRDRYERDIDPPEVANDDDRVPTRAHVVAERQGLIEFAIDADGYIWVEDYDKERVVLGKTRVLRGKILRVAPQDDRIRLDGHSVSKADLKSDHRHRVYLLRDHRQYDDDRVDTKPNRDDGPRPVFSSGDTIPRGGTLVRTARGSDLSYKTPDAGSAYLFDADAQRVVHRFDLKKNQRLTVDPTTSTATIDGVKAFGGKLSTKVTYKLYFVVPH